MKNVTMYTQLYSLITFEFILYQILIIVSLYWIEDQIKPKDEHCTWELLCYLGFSIQQNQYNAWHYKKWNSLG